MSIVGFESALATPAGPAAPVAASAAFNPGLPAGEVHTRLRAALEELQAAQRNAVLWFAEVLSRGLYRELGYSSIHAYAAEALGFSRARTAQYLRLSRSLEVLPALKRVVASGELPWTKARVVAQVATPDTQGFWIDQARCTGRRDLERQAAVARQRTRAGSRGGSSQPDLLGPAAEPSSPEFTVETPVDLTLRLTPEQYARYEALLEKTRKSGEKGSREEVLLAALERLVGAGDEAGARGNAVCTRVHIPQPRYQVVVTQCPDCRRAEAQTSRGPKPLATATLQAILCDTRVHREGERNRATIPPARRRDVFARDGYRCRASGCGSAHFLDVHHLIPRERGGTNDPENLITLCASCHRLTHERKHATG
jgi:5-methylcytosine-specific restriction endonuclease McrA